MKKCFALLFALCMMFSCAALAEEAPETVYSGMVDENGAPCGSVSWTDAEGTMHFGVIYDGEFIGDEYLLILNENGGLDAFHIYTHDEEGVLSESISYFSNNDALYCLWSVTEKDGGLVLAPYERIYFNDNGDIYLEHMTDGELTEEFKLAAGMLPNMSALPHFKMEVINAEEYTCYRVVDKDADKWIAQIFVYDDHWYVMNHESEMVAGYATGYRTGTIDRETLQFVGGYTEVYADGTSKIVTE